MDRVALVSFGIAIVFGTALLVHPLRWIALRNGASERGSTPRSR